MRMTYTNNRPALARRSSYIFGVRRSSRAFTWPQGHPAVDPGAQARHGDDQADPRTSR
jgi:hypothetical protein